MRLDDYQTSARRHAIYPAFLRDVEYLALGLCGEAGEAAERVKKALRDGDVNLSEERRTALAEELGDVLWYVAQLAGAIDYRLSVVAERNLEKLRATKASEGNDASAAS
jgi:NTP pyrophosphatase (non-canonical NTP hydrolase)